MVLDLQHPQTPAAYPEPGENTIMGRVWQGDGTPMGGASVELLRRERGVESVVSVATSDAGGAFAFSGVKEYNAAATYLVRASFGQGGTARNASSEPFDVYYHDRLGVPHEYRVEVRTDYLRQPLSYDPSGPLGFRGTPGAHIEVEGLDTGHTLPANFTVPPGTYGYRIWLEGYQDRAGTLVFTGDPCLVQADLQPSVGNLTVVVRPAQASISMDGAVLGWGEVRLANVPAGSHRLSFAAAGYRAQDHGLTLAAGADIRFELALEPIPVNVRIEAPAAARVVFDGVPAGQGTVEMPQVMPGIHILRVELEGYHPYERLVVVAPGENASIAVGEMLPLPAFSAEYMGYTWDNFVRGLGEILQAVLRSVGL